MALKRNPCNLAIQYRRPKRLPAREETNMSMLHLLRHAKSSAGEGIEDHERPLSRRGREAARRIGKHLSVTIGAFDLVLCSSARRTRETLDLVLTEFAPRPRSMIEDGLYLAPRERLIERLRRLDPQDANVLVIGHNPGIHELAIGLADKSSAGFAELVSGKFPTAAYASFDIPAGWSAFGASRHQLLVYVTPKFLSDGRT
jgi:phosphohistidine phosphatase